MFLILIMLLKVFLRWKGDGSNEKKNGSGGGGRDLKNDGDGKNGKKNSEKEFLVLMIFLGLDELCGC